MAKLLDGTRIYGTANVDTKINVGANVAVNTSVIFVGNSTVNTVISANTITLNGTNLSTAITSNAATAYTNATAFAANATNISSGTVANARLNSSNTTQAGIVQLVDGVTNTSVTHAATANSAKQAYDAAISANTRAASAQTEATSAYSNAIAFSANATNISSGTVANARLNSANTTQAGIVQLVDSVTNTSIVIAATANSAKQAYDAALTANTRAASAQTAASDAYTNAVAYAASNTYVNNTFAPKAGPTFTGTLAAADVTVSGNLTVSGTTTYINTSTLNVGDNIITLNADATGSPTENAGIEVNRGTSANVVLRWNETADEWQSTADGIAYTKIASNNDVTTAYTNATAFAANADNISSGTVANARLNSANTTQAGIVQLVDSVTNTSVVIAATANSVKTALDLAVANAATAYTNATAFAANATNISSGTVDNARLNAANTTQAGIVQLVDSVTNTSVAIAATANSVKTALDLAVANAATAYTNATSYADTVSGTAYTNAVAFAANATNISSGTLDTARLPATANVSDAINIGADVGANTTAVRVGNTTVTTTNLTLGGTVTANGGTGTAGYVLKSGGTANAYWAAAESGGATLVANTTDSQLFYIPMSNATSGSWSNAVIDTAMWFQPSANALAVGTNYLTSTGIYPTTNSTSIALGLATARWNLNANTGNFSGQITGTSVVTTTGVYPTSNTSGQSLGSASQRWVINANTGNFSGQITGTTVVTTTGVYPTSNTSGQVLGGTTQRWVLNANTINASANITTTATLFANSTVGVKSTASISSGTLTLDIAAASVYEVSLNANITTLTINNTQSSGYISNFVIAFVADGTARTVTWPASFKWPSGTAPTLTSTLNKKDMFVFFTYDGGTSWHAFPIGQNL